MGHQLDVDVLSDSILVVYRVEVPDAIGGADDPALVRELASGIVLVADGRALPTERLETRSERGSDHTAVVELTLRAPLIGVNELTISNGNLPEIGAYHSARVTIDSDWTATSPDHPRSEWTRDESQRRVRLTLAPASWPGPTRPLAEAGPVPLLAPATRPVGSWPTALVSWFAAAVLGFANEQPRSRVAVALAAAVGLGLLVGPDLRPWLGALGAAGIAVAAALDRRTVAAVALAAIVVSQPPALAVSTGALCLLPRVPRVRALGWGVAAVAAVVLVARAS